jgi:hypothetical protein
VLWCGEVVVLCGIVLWCNGGEKLVLCCVVRMLCCGAL